LVLTLGNEVQTVVPEPSTAPLAGLGLLALSGYAARRRVRRRIPLV
jgi:MYXO-CTERM domain-containing protein